MTAYVALLRAVNVGGTGKLPMTELVAMCGAAGFESVKTYIASGNVVFTADVTESKVKAMLEAKLQSYAGKPVGVMVRTAEEMAVVMSSNPFPKAEPSRMVAVFLDDKPGKVALNGIVGAANEQWKLGSREIYVHYPDGIGDSKLKIPAAKAGTARNMNTISKLAAMAQALRIK
jgi:uncharacterized protein (DUF1697 family)